MKAHRRPWRGTLRDIINFTIKIKRVLAINEKQNQLQMSRVRNYKIKPWMKSKCTLTLDDNIWKRSKNSVFLSPQQQSDNPNKSQQQKRRKTLTKHILAIVSRSYFRPTNPYDVVRSPLVALNESKTKRRTKRDRNEKCGMIWASEWVRNFILEHISTS